MNTAEFQHLLVRSSLSMMAVDGNIHDSEIAALKEYTSESLYFSGLDLDPLLDRFSKDIKLGGKKVINEFLEDLRLIKLSKQQERVLYEVLVRVLEADTKIEENELHFLGLIRARLGTLQTTLAAHFPSKIKYFIDVEKLRNATFDKEI